MTDFSREAQRIVEAVVNAADDIVRGTVYGKPAPPTPFQRAVIGGLVLFANSNSALPMGFSSQELDAARRTIAPFLDETPVPE